MRFEKDAITKKTYKDIITSPDGLFKGAKGRKVLLIANVYKENDDFFDFANYIKNMWIWRLYMEIKKKEIQ